MIRRIFALPALALILAACGAPSAPPPVAVTPQPAAPVAVVPKPAAPMAKAEDACSTHVELKQMETKTIPTTGISQYHYDKESAVEVLVSPDGSFFVVKGQRPGVGTLLLVAEDGTSKCVSIHVNAEPVACERRVALALGEKTRIDLPNVSEYTFVGDRVMSLGVITSSAKKSSVEITAIAEGSGVLWTRTPSSNASSCTNLVVTR